MLVEMKDICKDYDLGKLTSRVLKNVSLFVDEGDYIAIMGPSGSGKTTLMNLIGCLDVPTSGSYFLKDNNILSLKSNELSKIRNTEIGFIFQSFNLLPKLNAIDNVALPLLYASVKKSIRKEMAFEALKKVGLEEKIFHRPEQLSGGQCQRVAIARAIVTSPSLLLADEPTGALDSENGKQIMELFGQLNKEGKTIIMITHDRQIADHAKTIKYIKDGILSDSDE